MPVQISIYLYNGVAWLTVGPLISSAQHGFDDSDANYLTKSPTEIDIGREVPT